MTKILALNVESDIDEKEIDKYVESLSGEVIRQEGRVLVRFSGIANSRDLSVRYELVPDNGIIANASKWRNLSNKSKYLAISERFDPAFVANFKEIVSDLVGSICFRAEQIGLDAAPYLKSISDTTIPANILFRMIEDRLEKATIDLRNSKNATFTKNAINLADYPSTFKMAMTMQRKFIALLGEPNSGKTYVAMKALAAAETGVYLAPLRLLALENYEQLCTDVPVNEDGNPRVSLITGDERREVPGATHIASTVEMLDSNTVVDVVVIDEIQLLSDADRGAAWTSAVCGAPGRTVYLVGSISALPAIEALAERLAVPLEVRILKRKAPLSSLLNPINNIRNLNKGDAIIAFSRRDVLLWRDLVTEAGFSASTIYGNLSPESRILQAQRFADGESDVIIATDAIGMGLNLKVHRVIFTKTTKFNGVEDEELSPALAQQIAGRAGRYGAFDCGYFGGFDVDTHNVICSLLKEQIPAISTSGFLVSPSIEHLTAISSATGEKLLTNLLKLFAKNVDGNDGFFLPKINSEQSDRAMWLDQLPLSLEEKFMMSLVPISTKVDVHRLAWERWCSSLATKTPCTIAEYRQDWSSNLQEIEDNCKMYSAYAWLGYRMAKLFPDGEVAVKLARSASLKIDTILQKQNAAARKISPQKRVSESHIAAPTKKSNTHIARRSSR